MHLLTFIACAHRVQHHVGTGLVSYDIFKSPDSFKAFEVAKRLIDDVVSGKASFFLLARWLALC